MNAFISYSHQDKNYLDLLHKHLSQLTREELINTWTDEEIKAGSNIDQGVSQSLQNAKLFLALLSPDYIDSEYCYEKEFKTALSKEENGELIIVPIIVEPCDWLNTPFKKFKALPKDGKPVSEWKNMNTAFLNIIQELRALLTEPSGLIHLPTKEKKVSSTNYKIKKDFDSIQKMDFQEETFKNIKEHLRENISELNSLENIRARITEDEKNKFEAILVNRNKINNESVLTLTTDATSAIPRINFNKSDFTISYSTGEKRYHNHGNSFNLVDDEYDLFWQRFSIESFNNSNSKKKLTYIDMVDDIWIEWLNSVGIEF
ncbi:toll/interleukin-1 receptor domain-containing protein [uncultured Christiangramia sp.]|uniref:toll/interleukin-1 receptor domain-containing protein n=1 Tax=Christiangramia sp. 3-2217-3z TaxID=3417564 RepID=UPI0026234DB5|nr:toll/interleukin-1 receptor domain-containing protein [uncultured Christiangramia sp.]